ncbi:hypothetical protein WMW72_12000 [Paenibacillus filicis]|uniref:CopG-like ribbon-helix-helix domain-containing protein n=1 Tax=Paenibacillus filicis TaxID=669464 RepID=A0ABU9DID2_9BACL
MEVIEMGGRPPKADKKIREAIYFEPALLEWLKVMAEEQRCTVSVIVNRLTEKAKEQQNLNH